MPIDQQTFDFLRGEWYAAGGPESAADVAASIAFAESAGCQYALAGPIDIRPVKACTWNRTAKENSCGYWQINLYAHKNYSAPSIFNTATNASAAVAISDHGRDFGPWTTYTNGAYRTYLDRFGGHAHKPPPPPPPNAYGDGPTVPAGVWNEGWSHLSRTLSHTMPNALNHSRQLGDQTLRLLGQSRKVRR